MRHPHLTFIIQLLLALLTQVTLSLATPRFGQHSQIRHPSFTFGFGFPPNPSPSTAESTPTTSKPRPVSTPDPTTKPAQTFQNAVQASSHEVVSSSSSTRPVSAKSSSLSASHSSAQLRSPSSTPSPPPPPSPVPTTVADSGSPSASPLPVASTSSNNSKMLIEILVPVILAALIAGVITLVFYRQRRVRDKKEWEGSRLPELDGTGGIWPFGRSRETLKGTRPRDTYVGGDAWNRSDAHLRGQPDYYEKDDEQSFDGSGAAMENGPSIPASEAHVQEYVSELGHSEVGHSEVGHSEVGHGYVPFHSVSPMHDEPALAESRRGTLLQPLPLPEGSL
ncbi:hypothetical protein B0H13DRAFT_2316482 [Mycena leptocephala]|nr:hypothetical protein B0H13DRAFT_2316482 [Mycena leptocephala]